MTSVERRLVTIAKLALEALDEIDTPPAITAPKSEPNKKSEVKRAMKRKAAVSDAEPKKHKLTLKCDDCGRGFYFGGKLIDAACPSCKSVHVHPRVKKDAAND